MEGVRLFAHPILLSSNDATTLIVFALRSERQDITRDLENNAKNEIVEPTPLGIHGITQSTNRK